MIFHHNPQASYVRHINQELARYADILGNYANKPPQSSTEQEDAMYVTRGEVDIVIVQQKLTRWENHDASKDEVERALKQLERDVEDVPVLDDPRIKN